MTKGYKSLNSFFSKSNFIGSYIDFQQIPNFNLPEICFLGRSNVGKSSLINQLTKNKNIHFASFYEITNYQKEVKLNLSLNFA